MEHNLCWHGRVVVSVAFTPVVTDGVGEDVARPVEGSRADRTADLGIAL